MSVYLFYSVIYADTLRRDTVRFFKILALSTVAHLSPVVLYYLTQ